MHAETQARICVSARITGIRLPARLNCRKRFIVIRLQKTGGWQLEACLLLLNAPPPDVSQPFLFVAAMYFSTARAHCQIVKSKPGATLETPVLF
jgi:hypothetical protein